MKLFKKLDARGVAHHAALGLVVIGLAVFGVYQLVASHADTLYKNPYSCSTNPTLSTSSGSTHPACTKYLQYVLTNTSTSPNLTITGTFNSATKVAVQKFQFAHHVSNSSCGSTYSSCDGIVGTYTWKTVDSINAAKTLAALPAPTGTLACGTATTTSNTVKITYSNQKGSTTLYRGSTLVVTYAKGSNTLSRTIGGLNPGVKHYFYLKYGSSVIASAVCATKAATSTTTTTTDSLGFGGQFLRDEGKQAARNESVSLGIVSTSTTETSKVEWYLGGKLLATRTTPGAHNVYDYVWSASSVAPGSYRFVGKIYNKSGTSKLVQNSQGKLYLDVTVSDLTTPPASSTSSSSTSTTGSATVSDAAKITKPGLTKQQQKKIEAQITKKQVSKAKRHEAVVSATSEIARLKAEIKQLRKNRDAARAKSDTDTHNLPARQKAVNNLATQRASVLKSALAKGYENCVKNERLIDSTNATKICESMYKKIGSVNARATCLANATKTIYDSFGRPRTAADSTKVKLCHTIWDHYGQSYNLVNSRVKSQYSVRIQKANAVVSDLQNDHDQQVGIINSDTAKIKQDQHLIDVEHKKKQNNSSAVKALADRISNLNDKLHGL